MADGQVVFEISADGKKAYAAINDVTEALKKAGKEWETDAGQSTENIGNKFTSMFGKIGAAAVALKAGKALLDFGKDALQAASDLQEVQNVVDVTFGEGAAQVEAWAKTAGESFGLTELQAKRFTSTMGAMLKSSGLAGDEIIDMSTSLAGLAADMASFYNLDFDTAFQKIRSGIAGETEPLKQLGVNLSVANLEAFALQQGLSKTFSEMSSGEQTMLRYQYLMQATSDAQGDFARTADTSFANMSRKLQTNLESIKSNLGQLLIGPVQQATSLINGMLEALLPDESKRTVLDDLADIDIQKDTKIAQIKEVADEARALVSVLEGLNTNANLKTDSDALSFINTLAGNIGGLDTALTNGGNIEGDLNKITGAINDLPSDSGKAEALGEIAGGANELGVLAGAKWQSFANALGDIGADAGGNLQGIADALSTNLGGDAKKWENLLKAIGGNAGAALAAIGDNDGATAKAFLENVAAGADDLTTDYSLYWRKLLGVLGDNAAGAIGALAGGDTAGDALAAMASGANDLGDTAGGKWQGFIDALGGLSGKDDVPANLAGVADALAKNIGGTAGDWETLLTAVGDNLGKVTTAVGNDEGSTAAFLEAAAAAADDLGGDYSQLWASLLSVLGTNAPAAVSALKDATSVGTNLGSIAEGANKLQTGKSIVWSAMYNVLKNIDSLTGIFDSSAAGNVSALATALSTDAPAEDKAKAWEVFLEALGSNAGAITALTGKDAAGAAEWLGALSDALATAKIDSSNVEAWNDLLGVFTAGLSDDLKGDFTSEIVTSLLAMGSQSEYARNALASLGLGTDAIDEKQTLWLETCKRLVQTIPGLSSIINTETGEIKGGTAAVEDYIEAWSKAQEKAILLETIAKERQALENRYADRYTLKVDVLDAEAQLERLNAQIDETPDHIKELWRVWRQEGLAAARNKAMKELGDFPYDEAYAYGQLLKEQEAVTETLTEAQSAYNDYMVAYDAALAKVEEREQAVVDAYGEDEVEKAKAAAATDKLAKSTSTLTKAAAGEVDALAEVETAVKNANAAMEALADYQVKIHDETGAAVRGLVSGFNEVISPAAKARDEVESLTKALSKETDAEKKAALEKKLAAAKETANAAPSYQSIKGNLQSQLDYMKQYNDELAKAKANGVSDEILAMLSDGSEASFDYLYALNNTLGNVTDEEKLQKIKELNEMYAEVQKNAGEFTNTLTEQKLAADTEFQTLVEDVQNAVSGLDVSDAAYAAVEDTLSAIVQACGDKSEAVKTAVDGIMAQMARLRGLGYGAYLTGAGRIWSNSKSIWSVISPGFGSFANGLDNVPYDGYLALLHQGERIQTAAEADLSRRYTYQQPSFDYSTAGAAIGANIPRGNVYLDGRTVGQVLSDRQGNSYRALERSGWQG